MNTTPYRSAEEVPEEKPKARGVVALTEGELALWDSVYTSWATKNESSGDECAEAADKAVKRRRERFGVR